MGTNIANINNAIVTVSDDALIYVGEPGGANPDPFEDATITALLLKKPLQDQITTNTSNISTNADAITVLQNNSNKVIAKAQAADYTVTQNADSLIDHIYFRYVSGTPTVKVGTTLAADDVVSEQLVTDAYLNDISEYTETSRTLYISISGGSVDVVIMSKEDLFDIT